MEHPLINNLSELTLEELQSKISELNKKLAFAYRAGNPQVLSQLQMILSSYQEQYRIKTDELLPKGDSDNFQDKIDIGK
tara:strand:+ start:341 stop:577 length:237 start_codon:yes stop_codon:yes gene_type:complete